MKRNILMTLSLVVALLIALPGFSQTVNNLSKKEQKEGWVLLFNGKNFDGWRQCNGNVIPVNWVLKEDAPEGHLRMKSNRYGVSSPPLCGVNVIFVNE